MIRKIKLNMARWALKTIGAEPSLFIMPSAHGAIVEVTVRDQRVWINVDGKCSFRATAASHVVIDDGLEDDLAVRISRGRK